MHPPIVVDRRSALPLQRQIYEAWRRGILSRRFAPGDRMPSTRDLAGILRVSRTTVTAAYDQLAAEGYLESERGAGTFVCRDLPDEALAPARGAIASPAGAVPVRLSRYGARLEPEVRRRRPEAGVIDLSNHGPDLEHFPSDVWRRLIQRHLRPFTPATFDYAEHGAGLDGLREAIASYLGRARAVQCTAAQVVVVNGSQQALDLCSRVLIDPGDDIAIEEPSYVGARQLFSANGARLRPVPLTPDGLSVPALPPSARVVYITPSHQFPTGISMSLARRLELVEWARARGAVIIEDDYDSEYRYSGAPLPALQGLAGTVPVVYVGTFSNVMFPGLRLGYLVVPPGLVEPFRRAKWHTDRHTAALEQAALADFIREGHMERHVRRMRRLYKRRRDTLVDALDRSLGGRATTSGDAAGMFALVTFDSGAVQARAARNRVRLASTAPYYLTEAPPHECLVRFAGLGERTIREAVRRLAR